MTEDEVRVLLGDGNIVNPVQQLIDGEYTLEEIQHVYNQLLMKAFHKGGK